MPSVEVESDIDLLAELVGLDDFQCCDANHPRGISFHDPSAPAEFLIVSPCCGDRGLLCRRRAAYLRNVAATIHCMRCDRRWPPERYRFIPLPGAGPL
ncbi:hypothetical protein ACPPVW_15910 [Leifsonia sp. McL0607]|uniref:hypothetical protein n=1 Tax=Leifsonia sp. McL0607 TaxID=3415672 RepID=UPI003CF438C4